MLPRIPRPKFAETKVCRIQGWKTRFLKYLCLVFKVFIKNKTRQLLEALKIIKMFKLRKEKMEKIKNVLLQTVAVIFFCTEKKFTDDVTVTDDAGMSKHRLSPYYTYYHNWHTLNFTASDSSSDDRCLLKVLIVLQLTQLTGSIFQLSITN